MPYSIEARSLEIFGVASHDFWVLRDERGQAVAELHGLATDRRTGEAIPIGTDESRHSLRIWHFAHDESVASRTASPVSRMSYIQDDQRYRTVLSGPENEVMARWNAAVKAVAPLNGLDRDYPNFGFRIDGSTVNSNSAYRTLGEVMGLPVRDFPGVVEPGLENRMTSPAHIEDMRVKPLPVLDVPARREGDRYAPLPDEGLSRPPLPPDGLLGQAAAAVDRLETRLGRSSDEASDRLSVNLAALAGREGFDRVDHVVLSIATDRLRAGENVFVVQGELQSPTNRVAYMRSDDALLPPTLEVIAQAHATARTTDMPGHVQEMAHPATHGPRLHHV